MSNVIARSLFHTAVAERSWKTKVTSAAIHVVVIGAAFLITVPVVQDMNERRQEHVTLVAPVIPRYHATIEPPRMLHRAKLEMPVPEPVKVSPPVIAKIVPPATIPVAPKPVTPARPVNPEPRIVAEAKPAPAPKPLVKTGSFQDLETAKAAPVPKQVVVGGFGDPRGVQASDTPKPQPVLMARVGGFDNPTGAGQAGGGGHLDSGAVKQSGFGNAGITTNGTNGTQKSQIKTGGFGDGLTAGTAHSGNGVVRSSGFGDTVAAVSPRKEAVAAVAAFTPVEILFKPRPSYSAEARGMRLEGQVSLEVVFQASGAVKVVRVIKGLGHGLDEAAQQAASQVRFKPATRGGAPVDTNATINITFELT